MELGQRNKKDGAKSARRRARGREQSPFKLGGGDDDEEFQCGEASLPLKRIKNRWGVEAEVFSQGRGWRPK